MYPGMTDEYSQLIPSSDPILVRGVVEQYG